METLIRVRPDELKMDLLEKIKNLIQDNDSLEIIIHVKEKSSSGLYEEDPAEYFSQLNKSIRDKEEGRTVSFTMETFEKYLKENFSS
jgi:hypothetical protein